MRALLLAILLLALPLAGCAEPTGTPTMAPDDNPPRDPAAPQSGPEWSFTDTDGAEHTRDSPAGKATVMFFMATWCGSCRSKAPLLRDVHAEYADRDVRFYSLDFDPTESREDIEAWKSRYGHDWPHGIDHDRRLQQKFGVTSQSTVVLLDEDGNLVKRWDYGKVTADQLRAELDATLA